MQIQPIWSNFFAKKFNFQQFRTTICVLIFASFCFPHSLLAQETVSAKPTGQFGGVITATNNGVSIIPSFTLGRPALLFDLSLSGERFSFDPMLRFGMDGKPWSFVFWGRYKAIKDKRFTLSLGAHPAFIFAERIVKVNGKEETMLVSQRFLAMEVAPTYKISKRLSMGLYYLRGHGFNPIPPDNSNFIALNTVISGVPVGGGFTMRINPQLFYLKVDDDSGTYATSNFTVSKPGFPIGFQGLVNQKIKSSIPGDDLIWNVGLLYIFSTPFHRAK
ncbi:MAG: hypothetical protein NWQ52_06315 [Algoriphagus sp.]|jgi:hypothetical protein|uniref:hypothetical protein n=1 Tax=Algoriphagus sp. TaxID=1872435 RepID=UPI00276F1982|nr:hypothetical protein [Algoriphagus sp.]MDP4957337.1 hypothetical protein [Algoriphagus sp.]MDP5125033.1 hypothetical protein [Algoriphagus sp.]